MIAFCDFDVSKVGRKHHIAEMKKHIPILHFSRAVAPIIICVSSKRAEGDLEKNIAILGLKEGEDYFHFS